MRKRDNASIILANLTKKEYARFFKARIPYSGATGADADPKAYGGVAPYIAISMSELQQAVRSLLWRHFAVKTSAQQWLVTKVVK